MCAKLQAVTNFLLKLILYASSQQFFLHSILTTPLTFFSQFVAFCEKLARVMKLDEIADDAGLDVNGEAILARGEQLVKLEVSQVWNISGRIVSE